MWSRQVAPNQLGARHSGTGRAMLARALGSFRRVRWLASS